MRDQTELALPDFGIPEASLEKANRILELLPTVTSLSVVSDWLRTNGLAHSSSSWDDVRERRILPALRQQRITVQELAGLLSECEEYGRAHVFLFICRRKEAEQLGDRARVAKLCERLGLTSALQEVLIEEIPSAAVITQIRPESYANGSGWVFKMVEGRREKRFLSETEEGNRLRREWEYVPVRAVNVARMHESGLLEIRIQGHIQSTLYQQDLARVWGLLKDFLPPTQFVPVSLAKAKGHLWANREALRQKVRFSDSRMRNSAGTTLTASTGPEQADLFEDSGAAASLDQFLGHGAHCDSSNVWWRPVEGVLSREIHMLLSGMPNEFALTANCTRSEYEYVLNELRTYCR